MACFQQIFAQSKFLKGSFTTSGASKTGNEPKIENTVKKMMHQMKHASCAPGLLGLQLLH